MQKHPKCSPRIGDSLNFVFESSLHDWMDLLQCKRGSLSLAAYIKCLYFLRWDFAVRNTSCHPKKLSIQHKCHNRYINILYHMMNANYFIRIMKMARLIFKNLIEKFYKFIHCLLIILTVSRPHTWLHVECQSCQDISIQLHPTISKGIFCKQVEFIFRVACIKIFFQFGKAFLHAFLDCSRCRKQRENTEHLTISWFANNLN